MNFTCKCIYFVIKINKDQKNDFFGKYNSEKHTIAYHDTPRTRAIAFNIAIRPWGRGLWRDCSSSFQFHSFGL